MLAAPFGEQRVAGYASDLLYSTYWLLSRPDQDFVTDRPRRKPAVQPADLSATFRPQPMIHRHRTDAPAALARPTISENGEGEAVCSTGNGNTQERATLEASKRGKYARKLGRGDGPG